MTLRDVSIDSPANVVSCSNGTLALERVTIMGVANSGNQPNARASSLRNIVIDQRLRFPGIDNERDPTGIELLEGSRTMIQQALVVVARDFGFLAKRARFSAENLKVVMEGVHRTNSGYQHSDRAFLDEALRAVLFEDNETNVLGGCR